MITEDRSECYCAKSLTKGADAGRNDTALKRAGWARPGRSRVRSLAAAGFLLLLVSLLALPMQAQAKTVTTDWGLVASGLGEGDWFRLVVVTSGTRNETVTNIATYNTFVQNDVSTTGHTDTTSHSSSFKVLGCTSSTNAITNTSTGSSDTSAPIYWLGGVKVSDTYAHLYDNSWHSNVPTSGITSRTFTGCLDDGQNSQKFHLGEASQVTQGYPANQGFEVSGAGSRPGNSQKSYGLSGTRPMYGVSEVFQVGDTSSDATLSGLTLENASDDSGVTLNEMFASTTTFYTADVANDVDKVTIKPTLSDSNAAYVFLDDSDAELTDSDTTKDNFQVALAEGLNTIKVKVTAENDMSIETYTVVVTRAPSTRVLVSNTGQDADGQQNTGSIGGFLTRNAQRFTTGSNTGGYTLEEVKISLTDVGVNSVPVITINAGNGVNPGTVLYNLTNPANLLSDTNIFTPPADATLSADTNYFVVMENSNTDNNNAGRYGVVLTSDNSEDNVGLSDWSIADIGRTGGNSWGNVSFSRAFKIRLSGTVEPSEPIPASTDATLSGLSVNDGTSDLTLTPGFVSGTYVYAADVGNAVEEVTLSATVNDDGAEVSGVTLDGTAVADTDFTDGITVPSLVVGDNVIVVTVTAEETSIILTYSITVTRATIAPGAPTDLTATAAGETRINLSWTAPTSDGGATISGYKVEVSLTGTSGWSDLVANTGATDTTYSHTGLSAGNTRHYRVKAINSAGTGSASDVAGATTAAANVLVSNTGQTVDPRLLSAIGSRNKTYSQGFETGTNPGGYSLASVGVYVYVETLGTGETFTVHIYTANSAGAPDTLAYTLTSPASYADGAVNTFTAPAGATLDAATDYFVVFEGTADASLDFILGLTSSDEQDRGSRSGWEIEDTNRYQGLMQTAGNSYQISVNGSAIPTDVPSTWALKPTGLTTGDTFRLLFLSSTKRDASSTDIADYNTFIQTTAAAGHTAIQEYSSSFTAVGCTSSTNALDNTDTIGAGVPIYWLGGDKAADDYEDFYDGTWDNESDSHDRNEDSSNGTITSISANYPWTGCDHDGTEEFDSLGGSEALGGSLVSFGRPNDSAAGNGPLDSGAVATSSNTRPFYGLSEIFQVVASSASTDATLSALTVNDGTNDLTLDPTFAYGTYIYAVEVGNAVDEVTVTATVNHPEAEVSGVTLAGTTIADSDFTDGITVPSLIVGDNEIVVTVTAADTTTQAYTLTVTRSTPGNTRVGEDLTATTGGISDAEGKTNAENGVTGYAYTYKWFRVNGGTDTEITGQTALTYTLVAADVGKKIKVMVAFSDDAGNVESPVASDAYPSSGTVLAATIAVSISADKTSAVFKEDGITYTLTRTGSTAAALPVSVTLTQTKSFLATTELSKTVTIPAGQSTETFTVAGSSFQHFPVGDVVEGGTLTAAVQDGTDYDLGTPSSVAVNIVIGAMIRIEMASYTVNEADGSLLVKLIARTGPGAPQPTANSSSVDLLFEDVTAIENTDYFSISGNNFVFSPSNFSMNAGVWEAEKTYPIVITNDDIDEDDETFLLKLEYLHNMGDTPLVDSTGNACDSVDGCEVTVTIVDNDTAGVTVSKPALTVMEQDTTGDTYTVALDSQPTAGVTVTVSGHTGTDVTPNPTSLPFTTGNWSTPQIVTVTAGNDTDTVSDSVTLTHSAASSDTDYSGISIANVGVTVNDNDSANSAPTFPTTTADRTIAENTAAGENVGGTFTATDSDGDTLTYTLEGTDAASFNLITASGSARIRTKAGVTYNHEVKSTYTVVVKADDSNGGTAIVTVTITITDVNEAPGRPAAPSVSGTAGSTTSLTVSWAAPDNTGPDINNYDLQYRQGTSGSFTNGPQNVTGITTTIPNLSANTSYQVQVRATNAEGDSPWSPSGTGSTGSLPVTPPGQVMGVNITSGDRTLQVNWAQVSGATGYKVQWKSGGQSYNSSSRQATISSGSTTSRTISSLNNGTEYTVRVTATKTGASDGTPSDDVNGTPTAAITAPGAPRGLNATAVGNTRINLSWNAPDSDGGSPITGYKIEVSSNGNSWTTRVANTGSANRTYSHTGLSTGDTRHYRVSAINSSGTGPHSNVARASTGLPVVSIAPASTTEGQDIVFIVTISPPIEGFRRLSYGTGSDSIPSGSKAATAGTDYVTPHTASKIIQIDYGLTSVEIRFSTIDDDLVEGTEVFEIGLHGSSDEGRDYSVGTRTAIGTIRDNDNNGQRYVDTVRGNTSTGASVSSGGSVTGRIEEVSDADWYGLRGGLAHPSAQDTVLDGKPIRFLPPFSGHSASATP